MDHSTLKDIQAGNREAFKQLYDEYFNYAIRVAKAVTRHDGNAADAVQETFIRVYQHIHHYDAKKPFKPWFYRILMNECKRILSRSSKVIPIEMKWDNRQDLAKSDEYKLVQFGDLYQAIQSLRELHRIPIILKYVHDLTDKEIAETLETNVNTIKSRLMKAKGLLKEALKKIETKEGSL